MTKARIEDFFTRVWVCDVVRSGYHNGARCNPDDPHEGWRCSYRYEVSMTDTQYKKFLKVLDSD